MHAATLAEVLDSGLLRVAGYFAAASVAVARFSIERRLPRPRPPASWPTYWLLSAGVLAFLGVSRETHLGGSIADLGREQARSGGWYDGRRTLQTVAVIAVAGAALGVTISVWRVPQRRRRYLASIVSISTLVAFAAVRVVSLHHIDAVLYGRSIGDVRLVAAVELVLLLATIASIVLVRPLSIAPRERSAGVGGARTPDRAP